MQTEIPLDLALKQIKGAAILKTHVPCKNTKNTYVFQFTYTRRTGRDEKFSVSSDVLKRIDQWPDHPG